MECLLVAKRREYHQAIGQQIVRFSRSGGNLFPNFADGSSKSSVAISNKLCEKLGFVRNDSRIAGQEAGRLFEQITCNFIRDTFEALGHLCPGKWAYLSDQTEIYRFVQYRHLAEVDALLKSHPELASALEAEAARPQKIMLQLHRNHLSR